MSELSVFAGDPATGFSRFYREVHADDDLKRENGPYLWQRRLAEQLVDGRLPEALQAPTGSGKTTLVEAFLFALAWQRHHEGGRTLPLRLFWVVDRRSVVDQAHRHAKQVADQVNDATDARPALEQVKLALAPDRDGSADARKRSEEPAVQCQRWRGGTGLRPTTLRPDSAAVICSTVDQVGSRLLFRGYGTSRAARPIDAALVGTDSLIVVDEAHIAQPFVETVKAIAKAQASAEDHPGHPARTLCMSATLSADANGNAGSGFRLTEEELAEPSLAKRVDAQKLVRVGRPARTRVGGLTAAARELAEHPGLIGVVANTVGEARQVHAELSRDHEAWLLIGPNRPIFRDALIDAIPPRAERAEGQGPKLIVATQTIEVGVDLDFDALVTACAPLDALVQRLGRLDRAGEVGDAQAIVIHSKEPCPVYGEATASTWALLNEWASDGVVPMGPRQIEGLLAEMSPQQLREATSPRRCAPLLTPWQVEALSQTSEDPIPSPEISLFLHGDETLPAAEVNIVWRADLVIADDSKLVGDWEERVRARPPHPGESIPLPIGKVKAWLRRGGVAGQDPGPIADVELGSRAEAAPSDESRPSASFVLVTPDRRASQVEARLCERPGEIVAGATVVIPRSYGCCDEFGWIPGAAVDQSRSRPEDLGDLSVTHPRLLFDLNWASQPSKRRDRGLLAALEKVRHELDLSLGEVSEGELYERLREPILEWLRSSPADAEPREPGPHDGPRQRRHELLRHIEESETGAARMIGEREWDPFTGAEPAVVLVPDIRDSTYRRARRSVSLADHSGRVTRHARRLASVACGDDGIVRAVEVAARYHDHGKLDPRFQRWLFLGEDPDPERALAKSGISPKSSRSERARKASGWPRSKRHEALSALLLARSPLASNGSVDIDLAAYLVAVHHGRNRPFLPYEDPDPNPVEVTADIEGQRVTARSSEALDWATHASAFARLNRRYTPWGLALIEATLVQADWLASQEEQE
ncbi:MAG TPA: type I-U CRISPR-associated helicase/endonuclease Cas3 [Conexibacter sp.]|jgi:CRISPR-associated endonuclease/helicase Cas3|nr:type I-U CRISPR-associated helicase/endonuclease Cas3 [Conexibacter sp.]